MLLLRRDDASDSRFHFTDDIPGVGDLVVPEGMFKTTRVGKARGKANKQSSDVFKPAPSTVVRTFAPFPTPLPLRAQSGSPQSTVRMYDPYQNSEVPRNETPSSPYASGPLPSPQDVYGDSHNNPGVSHGHPVTYIYPDGLATSSQVSEVGSITKGGFEPGSLANQYSYRVSQARLPSPDYPPSPLSSGSSAEMSPRYGRERRQQPLSPRTHPVQISPSYLPSADTSPSYYISSDDASDVNSRYSQPHVQSHIRTPLPPLWLPDNHDPCETLPASPVSPVDSVRRGGPGPCRDLPPLHTLNRPHPYRRDPDDVRTLRLLEPRSS